MNRIAVSLVVLTVLFTGRPNAKADERTRSISGASTAVFERDNLVAWCIVPFDGKNRGPAERAAMLKRLGLKRVAYDWRQQHVPEFEEEILQYKKHQLEYFAFWGNHPKAFELFEKYDLHPQIWQMFPAPKGDTHQQKVANAAKGLLPLVEQTRKARCKLGLYNHGSWSGEPANMVAVCQYLQANHKADHVGIVYNQHHAHDHINDFAKVLKQMQPYLHCLNLNGLTTNGDKTGKKILPLGEGEHDVQLAKVIAESGYTGPIGIIGHTQDDVEQRLADNLDGLDWIVPQIAGKPAGPKPKLRTFSTVKSTLRKVSGTLLPGKSQYPPITVECRITATDKRSYNILVANDSKASGGHWEFFSMPGTGTLSAFTPGYKPDHLHSKMQICDGQTHNIAMQLDKNRIQLFVDGKSVAEQPVTWMNHAAAEAKHGTKERPNIGDGLGIGRLVSGNIGSRANIEWVRISKGIQAPTTKDDAVQEDASTLVYWRNDDSAQADSAPTVSNEFKEYSPAVVTRLKKTAITNGRPARGLVQFASPKLACVSCHKVGKYGGTVGPDLTQIAKQRTPEEIIEAVVWPERVVKPEYKSHMFVTDDGKTRQGYIVSRDAQKVVLRDPTKPNSKLQTIAVDDIDFEREVGTLMPKNLIASMSSTARADLFHFLLGLGKADPSAADTLKISDIDALLEHAVQHSHGPTVVEMNRAPLKPELHPHASQHVNRDRIYDFYAKQADFFKTVITKSDSTVRPTIFSEFPGLDGGKQGHWGNQNETVWANNDWNSTELGSLQSGVLRGPGVQVARAICSTVGADAEISVCFDPIKLQYTAVWKDGFVKFSAVRHGFVGGLRLEGEKLKVPAIKQVGGRKRYLGLYRDGQTVMHSYRIGDQQFLDTPTVENGKFKPNVLTTNQPPQLKQPPQWPNTIQTKITHGTRKPYTVDTIELPTENPWKALMYVSGVAAADDGSAMICTMQGDVWRVTGITWPSKTATWKRFASGLHQPLGMRIDADGIFVLCRDQLVSLHDTNDDGEADFYECFANGHVTSTGGHNFICGLERDSDGNFYTASGNQGVLRISADGSETKVLATGFRNPDGIGLLPDRTVTVPCSEGGWTPATMICAVRPSSQQSYHGFGGPKNNQPPELPLVYIPRAVDNSAGGQTIVNSDRWGPLKGQMIHTSFGTGSYHLVLRDEVDGQLQGAVVPMPGEFLSGAHRATFSPGDGQLYVGGMQGWGSYTPQRGSFQRVRFTGGDKEGNAQLPVGWKAYENGVAVTFSALIDEAFATDVANQFAQCWNYRYSPAYGSPEFTPSNPAMKGHDVLNIQSAHVIDGRTLFLQIPEMQPVNQLHLRLWTNATADHELFATVHRLRPAFKDFDGYMPSKKTIRKHPIYTDIALVSKNIFNPYSKTRRGAREIQIVTSGNLSFDTKQFKVKPGELLAITLKNADVVPHNWALVKPGTLQRIGTMANKLIADPDAVFKQYVPDSSDVLAYTDIVSPKEQFTIYFKAPKRPGTYPYLCTFPGHWLVMNGEMIVE